MRRAGSGHAVTVAGVPGEVALPLTCAGLPAVGRTESVALPREFAERLGLRGDVSNADEWDPDDTPPAYAVQWTQAAETNAAVAARGGAT